MNDGDVQFVRLTPEGRGAIAVLLVEGRDAAERVGRRFLSRAAARLSARPMSRILHGHWGSHASEEVVVCRLSETEVEIHCHGGRAAVERIEADLLADGCAPASWRDRLVERETSVIRAAARTQLADARTERTAAVLLDQFAGALDGALGRIVRDLGAGRDAAARAELQMLLARSAIGLHVVEPWRVVLAGPPNVGKSSLVNALVGFPRSIVFDQPGTTRDVVTVVTAIDGWPIELSDTAGLRASDDPLESAGADLARRQLETADCAVLVFDATAVGVEASAGRRQPHDWIPTWAAKIHVYNKTDLRPSDAMPKGPSSGDEKPLYSSAVTGQGIDELATTIVRRLVTNPPQPGDAVPFTALQAEQLQAALNAVNRGDFAAARAIIENLRR